MPDDPQKALEWLEQHRDKLQQEIRNIKAAVQSPDQTGVQSPHGQEKRLVPLAIDTEEGISSNYNASQPGTPKSLAGFDTKGMQRLD